MERRVLVVEDDVLTREALRRVLENESCEVVVAEDGEKAVGFLARERYGAIVLDLALPKLSGTDVLDFIASTTPEVLRSVVVVTGLDASEVQKLFPTISETLAKPVMPSRLLAAIDRSLARTDEFPPGSDSSIA